MDSLDGSFERLDRRGMASLTLMEVSDAWEKFQGANHCLPGKKEGVEPKGSTPLVLLTAGDYFIITSFFDAVYAPLSPVIL